MEKIIVLGTGSGTTTNCFNTCFLLQNEDKYLLVDTGGGSQVINQLKKVNVNIESIHDVFISHKHIDHLLGIFYVLRVVIKQILKNKYIGNLNIYCSKEVEVIIDRFVKDTFYEEYIEKYSSQVIFHIINDNKKINIIDYEMEMLDLYSLEGIQFGFRTKLNNNKILTFLGDVPCSSKLYSKIKNDDWVLHEVFCQDSEKEKFKPHQKGHSTVKDVCEIMEELQVNSLVIWHTQDNDIKNRKKLYTEEGKQYFSGNLYVPNDLEVINL